MTGMAPDVRRALRRADALQQMHRGPAVVFGVVKKFGDDNGGNLAVQLTYSMFMTVFPLLLLLVTVLGIVLAHDPGYRQRLLNSAFGEFPVVGTQLAHNIHALRRASLFGLVVGLVGLVYGSTGLAQSGQYAMAQIWNIPGAQRPGFATRVIRSLIFLAVLGTGLVITTALSGFGTFGRHDFWLGLAGEVAAALANVVLYVAAFRILTPRPIGTRELVPGAVVGGVAWTVLQALGGYVVGHDLKGASPVYGVFGFVLGLMAWIYLGATLAVYAAEVNTVLSRHLWPRGLVHPPLTAADQRSLGLQAIQNQRHPDQQVRSTFRSRPVDEAAGGCGERE
jgi:YihY family inner membrane protein